MSIPFNLSHHPRSHPSTVNLLDLCFQPHTHPDRPFHNALSTLEPSRSRTIVLLAFCLPLGLTRGRSPQSLSTPATVANSLSHFAGPVCRRSALAVCSRTRTPAGRLAKFGIPADENCPHYFADIICHDDITLKTLPLVGEDDEAGVLAREPSAPGVAKIVEELTRLSLEQLEEVE